MYGLHRGQRQFFGAPGTEDGYFPSAGVVFLGENRRLADWTSSPQLVHEVVHHLQSMGTLFGRFHHFLIVTRVILTIEGAKFLAKKRGELYLTLREWRDDTGEDRSETSRVLNRVVCNCDRLERADAAFLGVNMAALPFYPHTLGMSTPGLTHFPELKVPEFSLHPRINGMSLGALALMESFSVYSTVWFLRFLIQEKKFAADEFMKECGYCGSADDDTCYFGPLVYTYHALGDKGIKLFPLAVDIALNGFLPEPKSAILKEMEIVFMSSGDGRYRRLDGAEPTHRWEDVHPGWRFHKIIELWRASKMLSDVEFFRRYPYPSEGDLDWLVAETCQKLAWRTPVENWASYGERAKDADQEFRDSIESVISLRELSGGAFAFPFTFKHILERDNLFWPLAVLCPSPEYSFIPKGGSDTITSALIMFLLSNRFLPFIQELYPYWEEDFGCPMAYKQLDFLCDAPRRQKESCFSGRFAIPDCIFKDFMKQNFVEITRVVDINSSRRRR